MAATANTNFYIFVAAVIFILVQLSLAQRPSNLATQTFCSDYCNLTNGVCVYTNNNNTRVWTSCYCKKGTYYLMVYYYIRIHVLLNQFFSLKTFSLLFFAVFGANFLFIQNTLDDNNGDKIGWSGENCTVFNDPRNAVSENAFYNWDCKFFANTGSKLTANETNSVCGCNINYGGANCNETCPGM